MDFNSYNDTKTDSDFVVKVDTNVYLSSTILVTKIFRKII
jgi:hypothetical protein